MSVTLGSTTTATDEDGNSSASVDVTVDSGADRALAIRISSNSAVSGVTVGGNAATLVGTVGTTLRATMYYFVAPPTGSQTVAVTLGANSAVVHIAVTQLTGVHQSVPIGTPNTASGSGPVSLVVAGATGDLVLDAISHWGVTNATAGAGQSAQYNLIDSGNDVHGRGSSEAGGASVTMSWSDTNDDWESVGVAFKESTGASTTIVNRESMRRGIGRGIMRGM